jgi:pimeloyl-ACP methyl ester carboxylesterase
MTSWPDDVAELADALGAEQFSVVGWSAGAKNAVACAAKISDRLSGVAAVSGFRAAGVDPGGLRAWGGGPLVLRRPRPHGTLVRRGQGVLPRAAAARATRGSGRTGGEWPMPKA